MICLVIVNWEVDVVLIDSILKVNKKGWSNEDGFREFRRYFYFDFDVEVCLREIGWGFMGMFWLIL